jgi:hypothetical protein
MEAQPLTVLVAPGRRGQRVDPFVADVHHRCLARTLPHDGTDVPGHPERNELALPFAEAGHRHTLDQPEPESVRDVTGQSLELWAECRQRKGRGRNGAVQGDTRQLHHRECGEQLGPMDVAQAQFPAVANLIPTPGRRSTYLCDQ